ncbi:hypothetical protein D3C72_2229410 [compost metagenome]
MRGCQDEAARERFSGDYDRRLRPDVFRLMDEQERGLFRRQHPDHLQLGRLYRPGAADAVPEGDGHYRHLPDLRFQ